MRLCIEHKIGFEDNLILLCHFSEIHTSIISSLRRQANVSTCICKSSLYTFGEKNKYRAHHFYLTLNYLCTIYEENVLHIYRQTHTPQLAFINNNIYHFNGNPADIFPPPHQNILYDKLRHTHTYVLWKLCQKQTLDNVFVHVLNWLIVFVTSEGGCFCYFLNCLLIYQNN